MLLAHFLWSSSPVSPEGHEDLQWLFTSELSHQSPHSHLAQLRFMVLSLRCNSLPQPHLPSSNFPAPEQLQVLDKSTDYDEWDSVYIYGHQSQVGSHHWLANASPVSSLPTLSQNIVHIFSSPQASYVAPSLTLSWWPWLVVQWEKEKQSHRNCLIFSLIKFQLNPNCGHILHVSSCFYGGHFPAPISGQPIPPLMPMWNPLLPSLGQHFCKYLLSFPASLSPFLLAHSTCPSSPPQRVKNQGSQKTKAKAQQQQTFLSSPFPSNYGLKLYSPLLQNILDVVLYSCCLLSPTSNVLRHPFLLRFYLSTFIEMALGKVAGDLWMTNPMVTLPFLLELWSSISQFTRPSFLEILFLLVSVTPDFPGFTPTSLAAPSSFPLLAFSSLILNIGALFYIYSPLWWPNSTP